MKERTRKDLTAAQENANLKLAQTDFFPATRYRGSKRKLMEWLRPVFRELQFESALDAFGGTGAVSYLLKSLGKRVTYNDLLRFNFIIGKALIENSSVRLDVTEIERLMKRASRKRPNDGIVAKNFGGVYFLRDENHWIDSAVRAIRSIAPRSGKFVTYKQAIAYFALFQSCLIKRPFNLFHRRNLNLRTAQVPRTFGNKITWDRPFAFYFEKFLREANASVFDNGRRCKATNECILDIDADQYDLVYLDPPYVPQSNDNSNYLQMYHFLEGLSIYETWPECINRKSPARELRSDYHLNRFKRNNVKETFEEMIYKFRKAKIVISYKRFGTPSVDFIIRLLKRNNKRVETQSRHYSYALNHQNGHARLNREVLIIAV